MSSLDRSANARKPGLHAAIAACVLALPLPAWAYIDPNAGGWLFQLLFPLLMAIAGVWAIFKQKLRALWRRLWRKDQAGE